MNLDASSRAKHSPVVRKTLGPQSKLLQKQDKVLLFGPRVVGRNAMTSPIVRAGEDVLARASVALSLTSAMRNDPDLRTKSFLLHRLVGRLPAFWAQPDFQAAKSLADFAVSLSVDESALLAKIALVSATIEAAGDASLLLALLLELPLLIHPDPDVARLPNKKTKTPIERMRTRAEHELAITLAAHGDATKSERKNQRASAPVLMARDAENGGAAKTGATRNVKLDAAKKAKRKKRASMATPAIAQERRAPSLPSAADADQDEILVRWVKACDHAFRNAPTRKVPEPEYEKWFEGRMLTLLPGLKGLDKPSFRRKILEFAKQCNSNHFYLEVPATSPASVLQTSPDSPALQQGREAYIRLVRNLVLWDESRSDSPRLQPGSTVIKDYPRSTQFKQDYRKILAAFDLGSPHAPRKKVAAEQEVSPVKSGPLTTLPATGSPHVKPMADPQAESPGSSVKYSRWFGRAVFKVLSTPAIAPALLEQAGPAGVRAFFLVLDKLTAQPDVVWHDAKVEEIHSMMNSAVSAAGLSKDELQTISTAASKLEVFDWRSKGVDKTGDLLLRLYANLAGVAARAMLIENGD